jgi:hypothetical protein
VEIELLAENESIKWTTVIGFARFSAPKDECSVLGHTGCLEFFIATFDGFEQVVELTERGNLRNSV